MDHGIHNLEIDYANQADPGSVRSLRLGLDKNGTRRLEVLVHDGETRVRLAANGMSILLRCSDKRRDFERAINLLRLHLPEAKRDA